MGAVVNFNSHVNGFITSEPVHDTMQVKEHVGCPGVHSRGGEELRPLFRTARNSCGRWSIPRLIRRVRWTEVAVVMLRSLNDL